ncbi:unnamed protein product [Lactuca saligna]|uniref:Uncharacterized protein n=1 Tax=Lactuca saligna TaxID=75948 RepID=A0AA36EQP3_LACSI|nr:unnamed protein product [Lactuca saligna]
MHTEEWGDFWLHQRMILLTSSFIITIKDMLYDCASFALMCCYMGYAMDPLDFPTPVILKGQANTTLDWDYNSHLAYGIFLLMFLESDLVNVSTLLIGNHGLNNYVVMKQAIHTLRRDNVDTFVLDVFNNNAGLFPKGSTRV